MDCIDIVVGAARGQLSRIGDYYTRDRSTPLFDEEYGGQDDLTAAFGYEEDGETTLLFRRKLQASESTDWTIENNIMHVAWARGQQEGDIRHFPASALERNEADMDYYKPDELKYHGHGNHRGAASFNFFDPPAEVTNVCTSGGCSPPSCPYLFDWVYDAEDDSVSFLLEATIQENQWVAVGFSKDNVMPETDIVAAYVLPGESTPTVSDRYATQRIAPVVDAAQNIETISGSRNETVTRVSFKRPARTADLEGDIDLHSNGGPEEDCPFVFVGVGGSVDSSGGMAYHPSTPVRLGRVCFGICADAGPTNVTRESTTTTAAPTTMDAGVTEPNVADTTTVAESNVADTTTAAETTAAQTTAPEVEERTTAAAVAVTVVLPATVRITSLDYSSQFEDLTNPATREVTQAIENEVTSALRQRIPNFDRATVTGYSQGSLVANMDLQMRSTDRTVDEAVDDMTATLQEVAATGDIAGYTVDAQRITFGQPRTAPVVDDDDNNVGDDEGDNDDDDDDLNEAEIIIIAVAAALVFVAFTVVAFKLWENNKTQSVAKSRLSNSSGSSTPSRSGKEGTERRTSTEFTDLTKGRPPTKFHNQYQGQEEIYLPAYDNPAYATTTEQGAAPRRDSASSAYTGSTYYAAYIP